MNSEGFDSHLHFAVFAGALTQEQADAHRNKEEDFSEIRSIYKTGNYALQYFCGTNTLAKNTGLTQKEAKKVRDAYWELNHSIIKASDSFEVKIVDKEMWMKHPINGYYYSLRTEKDKYSLACQSTASYVLDTFVLLMRRKGWRISLTYHDEILFNIIDTPKNRKKVDDDIQWCMKVINEKFGFTVHLSAAPEFGESYASVH
jgi:DNA polymerase I-like protein with 3'-5' exonuclease and polymerase domains